MEASEASETIRHNVKYEYYASCTGDGLLYSFSFLELVGILMNESEPQTFTIHEMIPYPINHSPLYLQTNCSDSTKARSYDYHQ